MTSDQSALLTLLAELHDTTESDRVRRIAEHAYQQLIAAEAAHTIGADRYERTHDRVALRNGTRPKVAAVHRGFDSSVPHLHLRQTRGVKPLCGISA